MQNKAGKGQRKRKLEQRSVKPSLIDTQKPKLCAPSFYDGVKDTITTIPNSTVSDLSKNALKRFANPTPPKPFGTATAPRPTEDNSACEGDDWMPTSKKDVPQPRRETRCWN